MSMGLRQIPGEFAHAVRFPAHDATDATASYVVFRAPFNCVLTECNVIMDADVTGANGNTCHLNLLSYGVDGAGVATPSELANKDYVADTDEVGGVPSNLLAGEVSLAEGTVLALQREKVGNGLALPSMLVEFVIRGGGI